MFYLDHMLIFKGPRVQEIDPKIAPKSPQIHEKQCLEMLGCLYSFLDVVFSIWSPFSLHFGAPTATLEPSKSTLFRERVQGGLQRPFGSILELKVNSKKPFGSILKPCGSIWDGFWEVWGRVWRALGLSPAHKSTLSNHCHKSAASAARPLQY